ncbi:MAG: glycosyltransferase [Flavobacteriales bacterium]|nr:glycosyltransferase [Flavobacteriales bacterium]
MTEFILEHPIGVVFAAICFIAWTIQVYYLLGVFFKAPQQTKTNSQRIQPVSVVICARNEEKNLMEHIPVIMEQNHPDFEVIIVNDSSWDDTEAILKALQVRYPKIKIVHLDEEKQNMMGKKFALTLGIKAAKHDIILLTDADCVPVSPDWIAGMTSGMNEHRKLVIGVSPYHKYPGWLNRIIRFDTMMIATHYLGFANAGKPYMGVGRNMAYDKELFFKVGGFKSHYSIASGDDDLFVNQVATASNTIVVTKPDTQTISEPKKTWSEWFQQKRRHFTTIPYYKPSHKRMLAIWPLSFFFMMAGFAGAMIFQTWMLLVSGLVFMRYIIQLTTLHRISVRLGQSRDIVWLALPLELHLYMLNLGLYFTNLMRKPQKWN